MRKLFLLFIIMGISLGMLYSQTITVTSPNGRESWQIGTSHNITWTSSGISGDVTLKLYRGGTDLGRIEANPLPITDGSYTWSIPAALPNGTAIPAAADYQVQVRYTASVNDLSDAYFTITEEPSAGSITLTSPNGGEEWRLGEHKYITWTSQNISENVWIDIYLGTRKFAGIAANVPISDGSYKWDVGKIRGTTKILHPSKDYLIEVFSGNSRIKDKSNASFTISKGFSPMEKNDNPANAKLESFPDFFISDSSYSTYDNSSKKVRFKINNRGAPFIGSLEAVLRCADLPEINRTITFDFPAARPLTKNDGVFIETLRFDWPPGCCSMTFNVFADGNNKITELDERNNNLHTDVFQHWQRSFMFYSNYIYFIYGGQKKAVADGQTFILDSPDKVIVAEPKIILMDILFKVRNCSSRRRFIAPRVQYYGADNIMRPHNLGKIWIDSGKVKEISKRIQLKIRRDGNVVVVKFSNGNINWISRRIKFKFGPKFF